MIPILYQGNETHFLNNGLGRLSDAISCIVTEERNGVFELEMTYPITGIHYADIAVNEIIYAKTEDGGNNQAFIIYKISKPLNGIVTINAQHISYLLNGIVVMPFSAISLADAMSKINDNAVYDTGFTFYTDIVSGVSFKLNAPRSVRNLLGGEQGSLLDTYGGYDYKFDNFNVSLLAHRGNDNGVTIRYGKNLTDLKAVTNTTSVYTGIVPYWSDTEGNYVYTDDKIVWSDYHGVYPYDIVKTIDFSGDFEETPTSAQLEARANSYLASNSDCGEISANIEVSFVSLAQTDEYKDIAPLERVKMCDTVTVQYSKLGVSFKTKVIKTVYNVLLERYDSISLGSTTYSLAQAIQGANDTATVAETTSAIQKAVNRASDLIRGGLGGHVVMVADGDGKPQEILIMDADTIEQAQKLWRWNLNGFGYSSTGYDGNYGTAITMDGQIVADFITAGELDASIVKAHTLSANALTIDAQNSLDYIHNYLPIDFFSNLSRFQPYSTGAAGLYDYYYETITRDGEQYTALVLDGSNLPSYHVVWLEVDTDYIGNPYFNYSYSLEVDTTTSFASRENFFELEYRVKNDPYSHSKAISWFDAGTTAIAGHRYTLDSKTNIPDKSDPDTGTPHFRFTFVSGIKIYLYDFKCYGLSDDYKNATLSVTADGLNTLVRNGNIISSINQSAEQVSIKANRIDLTGNLSLKGQFQAFDVNDNTNYIDMTDGAISIYNQGVNIFTVASTPLFGNRAGIFFGDASDTSELLKHTHIDSSEVAAPWFYNRMTGDYEGRLGSPDGAYSVVGAVFESSTEFYQNVYFRNDESGVLTCSMPAYFYANVYNSGGSVVFVSDRKKKKNIKDLVLEKAKSFIMALRPRAFKFKAGTSDRYHHGFIAQEVHEIMPEDWGVYCEEKDFIGLRYDELLADMVKVIQDQEKRITELERKVNDLTKDKP